MSFIPLALALALSAAHYLSGVYAEHQERHHSRVLSLSAGAFITLLFLEMLPRASAKPYGVSVMLLGFAVFHALEKYVYHHYRKSEVKRRVGALDALGFFANNFVNGFILVLAFSAGQALAYVVFIALLLHTISSSLMLAHIIERIKGLHSHRIALSSSTFAGGVIAAQLGVSSIAAGAAFAFIVGALFYVVVRDLLPREGAGRLPYFLAGVVGMYALLALAGVA